MCVNAFVDLQISGLGLSLQEITARLSISPEHSAKKGDVFVNQKYGGKTTIYPEDFWIVGTKMQPDETVLQMLERFLFSLMPASSYLKDLSSEFNVTVWVSTYPETDQINIHLPQNVVRMLHDLGVNFDYSVSYLKEFYDGTYLEDSRKTLE